MISMIMTIITILIIIINININIIIIIIFISVYLIRTYYYDVCRDPLSLVGIVRAPLLGAPSLWAYIALVSKHDARSG